MASDNPTANEVAKAMSGLEFPVSRDELVEHTRGKGDERLQEFFESLPDKQYRQPTDVEHELNEYTGSDEPEDMDEAA